MNTRIMLSAILQGRQVQLLRILLQFSFIGLSLVAQQAAADTPRNVSTASKPNVVTTPSAISIEDTFMQGQQYLEQSNIPLAQLSLSHIPAASPYAKLLAGNIAVQNGDYERAFLLLLPLQSNLTLTKAATASLHASLSDVYAKQDDTANALDQLILREALLSPDAIEAQHQRIWKLLSQLALQDLIALRGESSNTSAQGWIDLCLATKNQDIAASINTWSNSYPDHVASEYAKTLLKNGAAQTSSPVTMTLASTDAIALIITQTTVNISAEANAFYLGVKTALEQVGLQNPLRVYASSGRPDSVNEQYNIAKNEGAMYFMQPSLEASLISACNTEQDDISWLDPNTGKTSAIHNANYVWADETRTIINYASNNAMQYITIIASEDVLSQQLAADLQAAWKATQDTEANIINLSPKDSNLLDLKAKVSAQVHDMIILTLAADEARTIKPYLDISTPVFAYSRIHETANEANANLNAIRFVEIPFLLDASSIKPSAIDLTPADAPQTNRSEHARLFALGYDYLQLLLASAKAESHSAIINGLTGKLTTSQDGCITRQPAIARFSYDGVVSDQ